jgi:hypothetical protein
MAMMIDLLITLIFTRKTWNCEVLHLNQKETSSPSNDKLRLTNSSAGGVSQASTHNVLQVHHGKPEEDQRQTGPSATTNSPDPLLGQWISSHPWYTSGLVSSGLFSTANLLAKQEAAAT